MITDFRGYGRIKDTPSELGPRPELQQQADPQSGGFLVIRQLCLMSRNDVRDRLQLDEKAFFHNEIGEELAHDDSVEPYEQAPLLLDLQAGRTQRDGEGIRVHRLDKTVPQLGMPSKRRR